MKEDNKKNIMDVSKPGTIKPATNSKNIIIKSTPIIKDPMVLDDQDDQSQLSGPPPLKMGLNKKLNIEPIHDDLKDQEEKIEVKNEENDESTDQESVVKEDEVSQEKPEKESLEKPDDNEAELKEENLKNNEDSKGIPDGLIQRKQVNEDSQTKQEQLEEDKQKQHDLTINNLILSKKYFLPFNKTQKAKNKRILILGIILGLILILIWLDLALDAGLIKINGIHPITHFFS